MMKQWNDCKKEAKDALLLFRLGDFFEAFYEDATLIAKELQLTLTKRQGIPMCGVPYHAFENYLDKLIGKGHKVAIADQVEDPKKVKGLVDRKVVQILSPATLFSSNLLQEKSHNFFVAIAEKEHHFGMVFLDLTTSEFRWMEASSKQELLDEIFKMRPAELLISQSFAEKRKDLLEELSLGFSFLLQIKEDGYFETFAAEKKIISHFPELEKGSYPIAILAAGALFTYLQEDMHLSLTSIRKISWEDRSSFLSIDRTSLINLDILPKEKGEFSLLKLLDKTQTPMGARLLSDWVKRPLLNKAEIEKRHQSIEEFLHKPEALFSLGKTLSSIRDLSRLLLKVENNYASPRDLVSLKSSLQEIPLVKKTIGAFSSLLTREVYQNLPELFALTSHLDHALVEQPPHRLSDGNLFREGFCKELDELKRLAKEAKSWIANYQMKLREELSIKNLKVSYTKAFGYYIEVSKGQCDKVPASFSRRQTLVNAERFITEELKNFEYKVLSAEEKAKGLEVELFEKLKAFILPFSSSISQTSHSVALLDVLVSLSKVALEYQYTKPEITTGDALEIREGRHPILEKAFPSQEFIPNDTHLSKENQLYLITGPNMAGKSTYLRQVALITIMAQMGSFVPAACAKIGLVDKVFSRVGASDDLTRGESTFMVEMKQTAHILENATSKSLIILDEIGRGTSTYDGISIAWAVSEYLLTTENKKAKTLFATHYWELTELEKLFPNAKNYQVAVKETPSGIVFLHKIIQGGTDKSYGIHVARLAGLPQKALYLADKRLKLLEKEHRTKKPLKELELPLFSQKRCEKCEKIENLSLEKTTPFEALQTLYELQKK